MAEILETRSDSRGLDVPWTSIPEREINSAKTAASVREFQPDVIITSGCPLLKRQVYGIPRLATLNVHWGVAPSYRGEDTIFWPLYLGDYENIGVTIHQIDDGIDTGPVLAQGFPELAPEDTEATLVAKCAQLAAGLLQDVLAIVERDQAISGLTLPGRGRLFCKRDRKTRHEVSHWLQRKWRLRTLPSAPSRREIYIGRQPSDAYPSSCTPAEEPIES